MNMNDDSYTETREDEHKFVIKYKTEEERKEYGKIILNIVQKYELKDFSVIEDKAYVESRILYNTHTIAHEEDSFTKEKIEKKFLEFFYR